MMVPMSNAACRRYRHLDPCGFTLIEVIIVMAILAILAAIAIPNYTEYVQRGRRADAKAALLQIAQWQERRRTEQNGYATAFPAGFTMNTVRAGGAGSGPVTYNITIDAGATANAYRLTATRAGPMATDPCGDFTLTNLGARDNVNLGGGRTSDQCWAR